MYIGVLCEFNADDVTLIYAKSRVIYVQHGFQNSIMYVFILLLLESKY